MLKYLYLCIVDTIWDYSRCISFAPKMKMLHIYETWEKKKKVVVKCEDLLLEMI